MAERYPAYLKAVRPIAAPLRELLELDDVAVDTTRFGLLTDEEQQALDDELLRAGLEVRLARNEQERSVPSAILELGQECLRRGDERRHVVFRRAGG
jgi:hypothetical protein